jgi:hypothetical protein
VRAIAALVVIALSGCSFIGVRAPQRPPDDGRPLDPRSIKCNDSQILPTIDALGGAAAIASAGGGILVEELSETGKFHNFKYYYAAPLVLVGIVYFYSASFGTSRVSRCADLKEGASTVEPIRPIDFTKSKEPEIEIEAPPPKKN